MLKNLGLRTYRAAIITAVITLPLASPVNAQQPLYEDGGLELSWNLTAGVAAFQTINSNFGNSDANGENGTSWNEWFVRPGFTAQYTTKEHGRIYSGVSAVGSMTRDDGDPGAFTAGEPEDIDLDELFVGWESPGLNLLQNNGTETIDISYGRQSFMLGDGFLIGDGHFDNAREGTFWLSPRNAFSETAILRLNSAPVRGDIFYIKGESDQAETAITGFNAEYVGDDRGVIGAYWLKANDANAAFNPNNPDNRDGLNSLGFRAQGNWVDALPDLFLSTEIVKQWNQRSTQEVDSYAFYGEASYTFQDIPTTPNLTYRYVEYSGDKAESLNKDESFDSLFFGFSRGWGTWFQGEVAGEYLTPNTNLNTHLVKLENKITDSLTTNVAYYRFDRDEPVIGADQLYADELNFIADWQINSWLSFTGVYAVAFPGEAAEAENGGEDAPYQVMLGLLFVRF